MRGSNRHAHGHRCGKGNACARNRAHRRHSLDRALSPARRAKPARRISLAAREMTTIHAIRSKRVVTPEGVRAATVHLRDGADRGGLRLQRHSTGKTYLRRRRIRRHARSRGHARPHQRAGTHRLGGIRDGDARGGCGRGDDADRHAAQQHSRDDHGRGARNQARRSAQQMLGKRGLLGRRRAGQCRRITRLASSGCASASSVFSCLRACRNLRTSTKTISATRCRRLPHWMHRCSFMRSCPGRLTMPTRSSRKSDPAKYKTWLLSRPPGAETKAIEMMIRLAREFNARVHIVHLTSQLSVPLIRRAKKEGVRITAETCPHYLFFAASSIRNGRTEYKCAPPIRDLQNNKKLWTALAKNTIDFIVSDHSPSPPAMKCLDTGDFLKAWGGICFPAAWTCPPFGRK